MNTQSCLEFVSYFIKYDNKGLPLCFKGWAYENSDFQEAGPRLFVSHASQIGLFHPEIRIIGPR